MFWTPAPAAKTLSGEIGGYTYRLFVPAPAGTAQSRALVVALHGCGQSAADFRTVSRFDRLAERFGFAVLYPETGPSSGNPLGCWKWWAPENQIRGGEPAVIVSMVEKSVPLIGADQRRVYVLGLSSGGAMSVILGALYPEVFAAMGAHTGIAFAGATTARCALRVMSGGETDSVARARIAYHAQGPNHRVVPLMVIHGDGDEVVAAANAARLIAQFAQLNDLADDGDGNNRSIDAEPDASSKETAAGGRAFETRDYHDARGRVVMREIMIEGMGHAWAGGPSGAKFSDPGGPDASALLWRFLSRWSLEVPPVQRRPVKECRDRFNANFSHYWWHRRMRSEEYACDPWRWTWRRAYGDEWTEGRCP